MFNPRTNFEVSMVTCYEDMKDNAKCRNCDRLVRVTQGHLHYRHSMEHMRLPNQL